MLVPDPSSNEVDYISLARGSFEIMWVKDLSSELGLPIYGVLKLIYDNVSTLHIAKDPF